MGRPTISRRFGFVITQATEARGLEAAMRRRWWAGLLTCFVAVGWSGGTIWPLAFLLVRGRLPIAPLIGTLNDGWPFYHVPHSVFAVLLAAYVLFGWPLWRVGRGLMSGDDSAAGRMWMLSPVEALAWWCFALPIPPLIWVVRAWLVATSRNSTNRGRGHDSNLPPV